VAQVVAEHRVVLGVGAEQEQEREGDQDPAHRIARLVVGHHDAGQAEHQQTRARPDVPERQVVRQAGQHARAGP
jgi:hypothetical protein